MAGLGNIHKEFVSKQTQIHVTTPDGVNPLYLETNPDGSLGVVGGRWAFDAETGKFKLDEDGQRIAEAPECPEDITLAPMTIKLRHMQSPDAEAFRKALKVFSFDLMNEQLPEETKRIVAASVTHGWDNFMLDSDEGVLEWNTKNALRAMEEYPSLVIAVLVECLRPKKLSCLS